MLRQRRSRVAVAQHIGILLRCQADGHRIDLFDPLAVGAEVAGELASVLEATRSGVGGWARNYFLLLGARKENAEMKTELDQLRQETQYLRNELATADRAQTLALFIKQTPSKVVAARVIVASAARRRSSRSSRSQPWTRSCGRGVAVRGVGVRHGVVRVLA